MFHGNAAFFSELTRKPRHHLDAALPGLLPGYPMLAECVLAGQLCPLGCSSPSSPSSAKASDGLALAELLAALNPQHEMGGGVCAPEQFPGAAGTASPPWKGGQKLWSLHRNRDGVFFFYK